MLVQNGKWNRFRADLADTVTIIIDKFCFAVDIFIPKVGMDTHVSYTSIKLNPSINEPSIHPSIHPSINQNLINVSVFPSREETPLH